MRQSFFDTKCLTSPSRQSKDGSSTKTEKSHWKADCADKNEKRCDKAKGSGSGRAKYCTNWDEKGYSEAKGPRFGKTDYAPTA